MKKSSTWFLKGVLVIMALAALALCIFAVPHIGKGIVAEFTGLPIFWRHIVPIVLWVSALPFFFTLFETFKLLNYIEKNTAFSDSSVSVLKKIKYSALSMSIIWIIFLEPLAFMVAEADDAPGVVIFAFAFFCIPLVISVFAAVLERLLKSAIDMKSENELTV